MKRVLGPRSIAAAVLLLAALGPLALDGHAFSTGPPAGFTNAPYESNCTACHGDYELDSGPATFSISVPLQFVPGSTNPVTVEFAALSTSTPRHGFQITARDGNLFPAGGWQAVQSGITKNANGSLYHHEHALAGTYQTSWQMNWLAPPSLPPGPVSFYSCGNEANGNGSPSGDRIYSARAKMYQAILSTPSTAWTIGASHTVTLSAPGHAGQLAFIVPSDDPTPVNFGGPFDLEVNPYSGFYAFAVAHPLIFQNLSSTLNASGHSTATVVVPNAPQIIGQPLYFAAIVADSMLNPTEVSNAVTVKFH